MTTDRQLDESISRWLEETAPGRLPDRVLEATFARTRGSRQQLGWRERVGSLKLTRPVPALGGATAVVLVAAVALGIFVNQPRVGATDPRSSFLGTWFSRDVDGSTLTMTVRASGDEALETVVLDDLAAVCGYGSSTMTGAGRLGPAGEFVIPSPVYTCDNGSEPASLSGPPLEEQLRNLTLVRDPATETLSDNLGSVWVREGAVLPRPVPTPLKILWPQTSLEEVREAQRLADAGDPRYAWQVIDPGTQLSRDGQIDDASFFARFIREELGWEAFQWSSGFNFFAFIRCAPGRTNPLYPNDATGGGCAPTLDDSHYEGVRLDVAQPVREGPSGVWVVTRWAMTDPLEQVVPPSDAEVGPLLDAFLKARIDGRGAEAYADVPDPMAPSHEIPLLYATTAGARYERSEFEVVEGPVWPRGELRLKARLFAAGGTVVEQSFLMERDEDGRVRLSYEYNPRDAAPTVENGQAVPVPFRFPGGEVTFGAAWPWYRSPDDPQSPILFTFWTMHDDAARHDARLAVVADPRPIDDGCQVGPPRADVDELVRSLQSDPDLEVTAPVSVTLGGLPAVRMDVVTAPGASICEMWGQTLVVTAGLVDQDSRMRLYLLELPGARSRILAIAMTVSKADFERALRLEAPLLDSFQFDPQ